MPYVARLGAMASAAVVFASVGASLPTDTPPLGLASARTPVAHAARAPSKISYALVSGRVRGVRRSARCAPPTCVIDPPPCRARGCQPECSAETDATCPTPPRAPTEPSACPRAPPFNLLFAATGPNAEPLNPEWSWQCSYKSYDDPRFYAAPRDRCGAFLMRNGLDTEDGVLVGSPPCSTEISGFDTPLLVGATGATCRIGQAGSGSLPGHANWRAVTYTGVLAWDQKSSWAFGDDDYNFWLDTRGQSPAAPQPYAPSPPGATRNRPRLQLEFQGQETVSEYGQRDWVSVKDHAEAGDSKWMHHFFDGHDAVALGLLGVDNEHEAQPELHPVYALAVRTTTLQASMDTVDDRWLVFMRNTGNEGWCSHKDHPFGDAASVSYVSLLLTPPSSSWAPAGQPIVHSDFAVSRFWVPSPFVTRFGVNMAALTVSLPPPTMGQGGWVAGTIDLRWRSRVTPAPFPPIIVPGVPEYNFVPPAATRRRRRSVDREARLDAEALLPSVARRMTRAERRRYYEEIGKPPRGRRRYVRRRAQLSLSAPPQQMITPVTAIDTTARAWARYLDRRGHALCVSARRRLPGALRRICREPNRRSPSLAG